MSIVIRRSAIALVATAALGLTACSNSEQDSTKATSADASSSMMTSSMHAASQSVTLEDGYVRAMEDDSEMTAIFGVLHNNTDKEINIVSFSTTMDAKTFELHEVVDGKMRMKEGGYTVPAHGMLVLQPGHEHMMAMGVATPVKAGESVDVTLKLSDGSMVDIADVPVRTVGAGDEDYGSEGHEHMQHMHGETTATEHNH
ncbi:putative secreted protein [Corynebacterium kutscheri]|uniref:Secreted protein n=1 Tax=Corynebacterium kutscheri TaxID=35755 RepID=A0A0F6R231_9CORY|nr:copper chaperone PCu(A)C [Corynebacterium kutscheri]AKE41358.1 hypothetical protein UL82_05915 [Corynebacterium kutscheri]VEH08634.1 putative secreted protein [Corynebacterium kutscheri]VEH09680.1 putative secreted protein [Corynebacterium kutscheri]VEH79763.1 putative secreted protein [Corynebacterium kutscheri]